MKRQLGQIAAGFLVLVLGTGTATRAQAPTLIVLYNFTGGSDGGNPAATLIMDAAGNLYGTTFAGGASLFGTVFKLDSSRNETVLHSFTGSPRDGANPRAALVRDSAGNLYGTTIHGGAGTCSNIVVPGCGTIFALDTSGNERVLHSFTNAAGDGLYPYGTLIMDVAGNLYGTTLYQDASVFGEVFKLDTSGNETALHIFTGPPSDGAAPAAGLIMDAAGNLYGTTTAGGSGNCSVQAAAGCGTVFKLDTSRNETVLHSFTGSPGDGLDPLALITDKVGNLYGTTALGGSGNCTAVGLANGCGTVFKLDPSGNETMLHNFNGPPSDGAEPAAGLVMDAAGNLYGTTVGGGSFGGGTVFKLDPSGRETVLHSFSGSGDGDVPFGGLIMDAAGNLYGTTFAGGASEVGGSIGFGTVFKLTFQTPAPTITSISPTSAIAGGAGFTLTVNGTNFVSGSTVNFNGNALATTFVSATQLAAVVPASDIATASTFSVTVANPGGTTSNAVSFTVLTPQQATQAIINAVNVLFSQGVLNGGQDNSLVGQLQHAIDLMNAGKNAGAIGNLDSFISEVNDLLSSGVLSSSQAASLVSAAESVIAALP